MIGPTFLTPIPPDLSRVRWWLIALVNPMSNKSWLNPEADHINTIREVFAGSLHHNLRIEIPWRIQRSYSRRPQRSTLAVLSVIPVTQLVTDCS